MAPPCRVFPASDLPHEIQFDQGKRRKAAIDESNSGSGGRSNSRKIDLSACALFSMTQYDCQIDRPELSDSPVRCWPVQRWFRRCQDRKGSFMVETTKWEGTQQQQQRNDGSSQAQTQTQTQTMRPVAGATSGAGTATAAAASAFAGPVTTSGGKTGENWVNEWQAQG
ncbi:hypothetical protein SLS62_009023 [Diatrype stigma]|uniref:Uncharacterized protein n=1 Tax=Diatrype stigma TaxID=117547 RepID=A0AAN9UIW0_9PEZI